MDDELVPAVLLAAGLSRRLGRPKALVKVHGSELVVWVYNRLIQAGCFPVVVANDDTLASINRLLPSAHVVVNPEPDAGRTKSLQIGIRAVERLLERTPKRVVMAPVDRPVWNVALLRGLLACDGNVAPSYQNRKGHPVVMDAEAIQAVLGAEPDRPLRDVVAFNPLPLSAPYLHLNIDTEDDLATLGSFLAELKDCFPEGEGI